MYYDIKKFLVSYHARVIGLDAYIDIMLLTEISYINIGLVI